jgi:hypothetical protein
MQSAEGRARIGPADGETTPGSERGVPREECHQGVRHRGSRYCSAGGLAPWTVRHTYRSGTFEGVTIGSTKADAMEQILMRQRQRALDSVALIDDGGVLVAQESVGGPLTDAVRRIGHADHWHMGSRACSAHVMKPVCSMELYFSQDRLTPIVYESYYGPEGT